MEEGKILGMTYRKIMTFVPPVLGLAALCACVAAWLLGKADFKAVMFGASALFGMSAGGSAMLIRSRLEEAGWTIPRVPLPDFGLSLYIEYWEIAPRQNWSRLPIVVMLVGFLIAVALLFAAAPPA